MQRVSTRRDEQWHSAVQIRYIESSDTINARDMCFIVLCLTLCCRMKGCCVIALLHTAACRCIQARARLMVASPDMVMHIAVQG